MIYKKIIFLLIKNVYAYNIYVLLLLDTEEFNYLQATNTIYIQRKINRYVPFTSYKYNYIYIQRKVNRCVPSFLYINSSKPSIITFPFKLCTYIRLSITYS